MLYDVVSPLKRRRVSTGLKFSKSRCFVISPLRITDKNDKLSALLYYRYIDKIINNFLFDMSNYALKDMNMLNYGATNYTNSLYHGSTRCNNGCFINSVIANRFLFISSSIFYFSIELVMVA